MIFRARWLGVLLAIPGAPAQGETPVIEEYKASMQKLDAYYQRSLARNHAAYLSKVKRAKAQARLAGNLELFTHLEGHEQAVAQGGPAFQPAEGLPEELSSQQQTYQDERTTILRRRAGSVVKMADTLTTKVQGQVRGLTRANRILEAKNLQRELDRIVQDEAVAKARVLSRTPAPGPAGGALPPTVNQSLLLHYDFETRRSGVAVDRSPAKRHGRLENASYASQSGRKAVLELDGKASYVDAGPLEGYGAALSVAAWIFPTRVAGPQGATIVTRSKSFYFHLAPDGSLSLVQYGVRRDEAGKENLFGTRAGLVQLNQWQHVAFVFDGDAVTFFHNGKKHRKLDARGVVSADASYPAGIGANLDGNGGPFPGYERPFTGFIDEVMVFGRALTGKECAQIHDATR